MMLLYQEITNKYQQQIKQKKKQQCMQRKCITKSRLNVLLIYKYRKKIQIAVQSILKTISVKG